MAAECAVIEEIIGSEHFVHYGRSGTRHNRDTRHPVNIPHREWTAYVRLQIIWVVTCMEHCLFDEYPSHCWSICLQKLSFPVYSACAPSTLRLRSIPLKTISEPNGPNLAPVSTPAFSSNVSSSSHVLFA